MEEIIFDVQGSFEKPYQVTFVRDVDLYVSAHCTCKAGENGLHCKHRINILQGLVLGIVSSNTDHVAIIQSWLQDTDLELTLKEMLRLEKEAGEIKKSLSAAKREIARAMRGRNRTVED